MLIKLTQGVQAQRKGFKRTPLAILNQVFYALMLNDILNVYLSSNYFECYKLRSNNAYALLNGICLVTLLKVGTGIHLSE